MSQPMAFLLFSLRQHLLHHPYALRVFAENKPVFVPAKFNQKYAGKVGF
jgi:hypothetical protein